MSLRDTIVARVREEWPAYALTHGRQDFYVPAVRDGGNTAALIDLAVDVALRDVAEAVEFTGPVEHLPAALAGLKSTANTADLALGIVERERDERRAYAEVLHEDRARLKRELRDARRVAEEGASAVTELHIELGKARAEIERMRPVVGTAVRLADTYEGTKIAQTFPEGMRLGDLRAAVTAYRAAA